MVLQPMTLTCRTHSAGHKLKITAFCTQYHFNWHQEIHMFHFGTAQTQAPLSTEGSQTKGPISNTSYKLHVSLPSSAVVFNFYCLPSYLFLKQYNTFNRDMSGECSAHNNISKQVTGSLMARCQSDNNLQAVIQHVGEHTGP